MVLSYSVCRLKAGEDKSLAHVHLGILIASLLIHPVCDLVQGRVAGRMTLRHTSVDLTSTFYCGQLRG